MVLFSYSSKIVNSSLHLHELGTLYFKNITLKQKLGLLKCNIVVVPVAAIHTSTLYPGLLSPVCPVHVAVGRTEKEYVNNTLQFRGECEFTESETEHLFSENKVVDPIE